MIVTRFVLWVRIVSSGFFKDSPSLVLDGLNMKCLDVDFLVFVVLGVVRASWICALLSDINSENFSAVTSHVFFLSVVSVMGASPFYNCPLVLQHSVCAALGIGVGEVSSEYPQVHQLSSRPDVPRASLLLQGLSCAAFPLGSSSASSPPTELLCSCML